MDYELITLLLISFLCFYIKITYGIVFTIFWITVSLFGFFFSSNGLYLNLEDLDKTEIFYETFQGDYESLYPKLSTFHSIKRKFKLPNCFKPFGIFYDNPSEIKEKKDRAIIGILLNLNEKDEHYKEYNDKDFREYMKENKYKNSKVEKTKCLLCNYDCLFSVMNSFVFIAKIYIKMTNLKFFTRLYNPRWRESHIKVARKNYKKKYGILEIYDHKKLQFFIPLENQDNIYFYSSPTK